MENEKKDCGCRRRKWLIPAVAAVVALVAALVLVLAGMGGEKLYWNIDRMQYSRDDRQPDRNGIYWIRVACDGEVLELPVADRQLVEKMDARNLMCLELNRQGQVTGVSDPQGLTPVARKLHIKKTDGYTVHANGSMALNGMDYTLQLTKKTKIYDVMPDIPELGKQATAESLTLTDALVAYADQRGQITHVFVTARSGSANIYWRTQRRWDNTTKRTARVPDEAGVYAIEFYHNGSMETLKCKDVKLVNTIDNASDTQAAFCFSFDQEGYIIKVRDIRIGAHGVQICAGYAVRSVEGNMVSLVNPGASTATYTTEVPADCGIYDVSEGAYRDGRAGEAVQQLQVGDRVYMWTDVDGTPVAIYIQQRLLDVPVFRIYPKNCYESAFKVTTRTPNAEGWYEITLIKAGEEGLKTYRTQDKALVDYLDSKTTTQLVGLKLNNDVIEQVYDSKTVYGGSVMHKGRYVDRLVGCMVSVKRIGRSGPSVSMVMTPTCKVYDISSNGPLGVETDLREGDVIEAQCDIFGQVEAIFVTRRGVV